jgi:hypothetical protein
MEASIADTERGFSFLPAAPEEEEEDEPAAFLRLMAAAAGDVEVGEFEFGFRVRVVEALFGWGQVGLVGSGRGK